MAAKILDRINKLSTERGTLYLLAGNGHRGDPDVLRRIHEIGQHLEELWELRRRERVGQREGIDLLIDRAYEATYGGRFEDALPMERGEAHNLRYHGSLHWDSR